MTTIEVDPLTLFKPQPKFSQEDLQMAFNLVKDKEHWKNPIHVEITDKLLPTSEGGWANFKDMVDAAVIHFTGGVATFTATGNGKHEVDAVGYYVSCPEY